LQNIAKKSEAIGLDPFIAFFVKEGECLIIGSFGFVFNNPIILFTDLKDTAEAVLIDHRINLIVDGIHYLIQCLIL